MKRNSKYIKRFTKKLRKLWEQEPEMRFGQLMYLLEDTICKEEECDDWFYVRDCSIELCIEEMITNV